MVQVFNGTHLHKNILKIQREHANKGKPIGELRLEQLFSFCKTFKKITKEVTLDLKLERDDLQSIVYTTVPDDIRVTLTSLSLYVPSLTRNHVTQQVFNGTIKKTFIRNLTNA